MDSGLACLFMIARWHGLPADVRQVFHAIDGISDTHIRMQHAAQCMGLRLRRIRQRFERLHLAPMPLVMRLKNGECMVVGRAQQSPNGWQFLVQQVGQAAEPWSLEKLQMHCTRDCLYVRPFRGAGSPSSPGGPRWFMPTVWRHRNALAEVLLICFALQVVGLVTPLFFQVIMDKVLVQQTVSTLQMVVTGLLAAGLFDAVLGGLRSAVLARIGSRMDVELGSQLLAHALRLPMAYYDARRTGDSVARVHELDHLRSFITGSGLTVLLDLVFSVVFIAVLLVYSVTLSWVVLASLPLYVAVALVFTPVYQRRLQARAACASDVQSFLVETFRGMRTLKSMALEWRWQQKWESYAGAQAQASLSCAQCLLTGQGAVTFISRLVSVGIVWLGAQSVMQQDLTVGELVAFNMLASQVSAPILRIAQWWNEWQQARLSVHRLADLMDTPKETSGRRLVLPRLSGRLEWQNIRFRYSPEDPDVVNDLSLSVAAGEVVGIVGESGSGKSTLVQLLQRLLVPDSGRILIDGYDLAGVDLTSLRLQMGVVAQEAQLFAGTIRESISLSDPSAPLDRVIRAAQMAGAHAFISRLPQAYDTPLGEQGMGLSGGQRQRIAIARALLPDPRILLLDEATSALDVESELAIQRNMQTICAGRTVIIVAHRLTAVSCAHRIVVMSRGRIAETGSPAALLQKPDSLFRRLHALQSTALGQTA